ncbi:glutamate receptor ionotropic, delta-2 [Nephila pilipes]|uniref:Glutamate receptor ionotropic, delta-2 n=1 Tax=Nephila pilipes TaxID=299642 RepID=A0A8X6N1B8_NEPPI|nr:glutamate receptor ionotropic, delta-2 [Nephila pilipes]
MNFHWLYKVERTSVLYLNGSSELNDLISSSDESLRQLGIIIKRNEWFANDSHLLTEQFGRPDYSHLLYRNIAQMLLGAREDISISRHSLLTRPLALAICKNFKYTARLNTIISRLTNAGIYDKLSRDGSFKLSLKIRKERVIENNNSLAVSDMFGAFVILLSGYVCQGFSF